MNAAAGLDFSAITVLCVGDVMLDRFIYGDMERISPEAPVPVIRQGRTVEMLGGAGNVASNILSLGGSAILLALAAEDEAGAILRRLIGERPRLDGVLIVTGHRPTIRKTRFIATHQQVVRIDEESRAPLAPDEEAALLAAIDAPLARADAVVVSDYGKAVCGEAVLRAVIDGAKARGIPVFVDPKGEDFSRYRGAACITPNARELALAARLPTGDEADVVAAARAVIAQQTDGSAILATRSDKGMMLVEPNGRTASVPARAREVFDVSGAGDTVIATLALAHASGMSLEAAMEVANAAAGVVVGKLGTATADIAEVQRELHGHGIGPDASDPIGLADLPTIRDLVARWQAQGLRVGFTNGCFDILHPGHVALLAAARAGCDRLVVGLNEDASVARLKGPGRPVNDLAARATVIAAIRHVDAVVGFGEDTPLALITALRPDVLVKGADYTLDQVVGAEFVLARGGRVDLVDLVAGHSTTRTIARIGGG